MSPILLITLAVQTDLQEVLEQLATPDERNPDNVIQLLLETFFDIYQEHFVTYFLWVLWQVWELVVGELGVEVIEEQAEFLVGSGQGPCLGLLCYLDIVEEVGVLFEGSHYFDFKRFHLELGL